MYFKNSQGYNIYYEDRGNKEDQALIFLHAWGSSMADFTYTLENLEGYRRISYDHRGFGRSDKPNRDISLRHLATDLKELGIRKCGSGRLFHGGLCPIQVYRLIWPI